MTQKQPQPDPTEQTNLKNDIGRDVATQIKKGEVRNPKGRPPGSRNKLSEKYVQAMCADFELYGEDSIVRVREDHPETYLKLVASLIPKDFNMNISPLDGMSGGQLANTLAQVSLIVEAIEKGELDLNTIDLEAVTVRFDE